MFPSPVGMRMSQWQWLKSWLERPNFSEPKRRATGPDPSRLRISRAPFSSLRTGMLQVPVAHRRGAHHERTIGNCFRHAVVLLGSRQHFGCTDRRTRLAKGGVKRVDHSQMREAEVAHGAGGRPNIERIARRHQNHAQTVKCRQERQQRIFYRRGPREAGSPRSRAWNTDQGIG